MTTPPKELSPERCHQLREGGFLRVLINLLHEHTFEPQNKSEADFNIESFLMNFNRKAELRARLSQQIRTIVKHTAKNENELEILGRLEELRKYNDRLYNFIVNLKAITEDPSKLNECTDQLNKLAAKVKKVIQQVLQKFTADAKTRPIFEQFGGVFVIVDYLRAQTRFNSKCHQFESAQIDSTQLLRFVKDSKLVLRHAVAILCQLVVAFADPRKRSTVAPDSNDDIQIFLRDSRSLHEIMVGIVEDAYNDDNLKFVKVHCVLLSCLYIHTGVGPSTSHLKDCGVIKCLAKFVMEIKDPETLYHVLAALEAPLQLDRQNVLEFVSIDGAVDMLIDVFLPSKEKDEDVENAKWYKGQRQYSILLLVHINAHLMSDDHMDERLLAIYESRDIAAILVRHLEEITSINESSETTACVLGLLLGILVSSDDQLRKFTEMANGAEVVKRFESSDDEDLSEISKTIGELFG